jgi:hypothetical protein
VIFGAAFWNRYTSPSDAYPEEVIALKKATGVRRQEGGVRPHSFLLSGKVPSPVSTLEATQGQIGGLFSQLPHRCHQNRVASVGNQLKICPWVIFRVVWCGERWRALAGCA